MNEQNLNTIFNNFIDEIDEEDFKSATNLPLDTYVIFFNELILENCNTRIFESHEDAKKVASELAKQHPGHIISILRVIENTGFSNF